MSASSIASSAAASVRPAVAANSRIHLLVVCHGLWGTRSHVKYICDSAARHAVASSATASRARPSSPTRAKADEIKLVVLPASLNESTFTYDGIDVCGERVVEEIDEEIARLEENGSKVERFSIVGYSLGGLIARYTLGLLHSRTPSFFDTVRPVNFATFASPAIGIPTYKTFWSRFIRYLGARFLSRSGTQLYERDRFLPSSIAEGNGQKCDKPIVKKLFGKKEAAAPLLSVMADPRYSFYRALTLFERVEIYANAVKDRTVPFPTGAIEAHDPFALASAKAVKLAEARGEDTRVFSSHVIDLREGGLEVTTQPGVYIVESTKPCELPASATSPGPHKRKPFQLPMLLRPSSYPFSRPVSVVVIVFLPIALPALLCFLMGRFALEGRGSRQRIRGFRTKTGGGREGMLRRVGVSLQETVGAISENAGPNSPETAITAGLDGQSDLEGASGSVTPVGNEQAPLKTHPAFAAFASYGGTETPPMSRGGEPDLSSVTLNATAADGEKLPTDPILSPAQVEMIKNLNAIPQLRKHLAFLPHVRNSHAAIVSRDPAYPEHRHGRPIVDSWAKDFRL